MATYNAANPTQASVVSAIALANKGDKVVIPEGSAVWASPISVPVGVSLFGAGLGKTIITCLGRGLDIVSMIGNPFRISGIDFHYSTTWAIQVTGNCKNFRMDHLGLYGTPTQAYAIFVGSVQSGDYDHAYGVIDSCIGEYAKVVVQAGQGDWSWKQVTDLGGPSAVYVEDCTFKNFGDATTILCVDAQYGGRYVFRHNNVIDHDTMGHPLQDGDVNGFCRGTRKVEVYENTFTLVNRNIYGATSIEAGTGVHFNNKFIETNGKSYSGIVLALQTRRAYSDGNYIGDGVHDLSKADGNNVLDGNTDSYGYPILDQVGRGKDASTVVRPYPKYDASCQPQALEPVYTWGNTLNGASKLATVTSGCETTIKKGRDYYEAAQGLRSARPTTCAKGDGYWATDEQILYVAIAVNTWSVYYKPYQYPHPLRVEEGGIVASKTITFVLNVTAAPDFFLAVAPSTLEIHPGDTASFTISVTGAGGHSKSLSFAVTGLPTGCIGTFAPATIKAGQSTVLTITTTQAVALASITGTITATEI